MKSLEGGWKFRNWHFADVDVRLNMEDQVR